MNYLILQIRFVEVEVHFYILCKLLLHLMDYAYYRHFVIENLICLSN